MLPTDARGRGRGPGITGARNDQRGSTPPCGDRAAHRRTPGHSHRGAGRHRGRPMLTVNPNLSIVSLPVTAPGDGYLILSAQAHLGNMADESDLLVLLTLDDAGPIAPAAFKDAAALGLLGTPPESSENRGMVTLSTTTAVDRGDHTVYLHVWHPWSGARRRTASSRSTRSSFPMGPSRSRPEEPNDPDNKRSGAQSTSGRSDVHDHGAKPEPTRSTRGGGCGRRTGRAGSRSRRPSNLPSPADGESPATSS